MTGALHGLRASTRAAHARLEAELDPERLCATRAGYTAFLSALYGFHRAVEPELGQLELDGLEPLAPRSALIGSDLAALGLRVDELPEMPGVTGPADGVGARLGLLYVVEGSALGGLVLARIVERRLGLGPQDGAGFLAAGAAAGGRWRRVKDVLEREATGERLDDAASTANQAFAALHDWMVERGVIAAVSARPLGPG